MASLLDLVGKVKSFFSQPITAQGIGSGSFNPQGSGLVQQAARAAAPIMQSPPSFSNLARIGGQALNAPQFFTNPIGLAAQPFVNDYLRGQVAQPIQQGLSTWAQAPSFLGKIGGLGQAAGGVFNLTPAGAASSAGLGAAGGILKGLRTNQSPMQIAQAGYQGATHPTSFATAGLGIQNPIAALGVDVLAGNPKSLVKAPGAIAKALTKNPKTLMSDASFSDITKIAQKVDSLAQLSVEEVNKVYKIAQEAGITKEQVRRFPLDKLVNELRTLGTPNQDYMYRQVPGMNIVGKNQSIGRNQGARMAGQESPSLGQGIPETPPTPPLQSAQPLNTPLKSPINPLGTPEAPPSLSQDTRNILNGANVKERGFVTSVKESAKTPQAVKDLIAGTYVVKSNDQLKKDALALIKSDPNVAEQLAKNPQNDTHVQIGNELINYYGSKGEFAKAQQIAEGMANAGTDFGRAVQAFSQYDKTTPQGAIRFAQSKINEYNRANPTAKLKITDSQVQNIFDRAHKIQDMPEGRDRNIASNDLMNEVNNLIPSSVADKLVTVWKAGLLTSLRTHERNLLGNTIHQGAEIVKDLPTMLADKALSLSTGQRSTTLTLKGLGSGARTGLQSAKDIITKGYDPEEVIAKYDVRHVTWGNNPVEQGLKHYTDAVFRTLGAADKPFWNAAYARSLYDQAGAAAINAGKRGDKAFVEDFVKNAAPEVKGIAVKDANIATFHDTTKLGEVAKAIQGVKVAGIPVGQIVAPFTGVPSSVAGQMVAYSPIGLIKGAVNAGSVVAGNVPELQRQAAQEIGRGVMGTGLFGLGAYLASKGLMSGQPKDAAEAAQWQLENKPANSILINGKWRSIGSIGPENLILLAGAKAAEEGAKPDGSVGNYAGNLGKDYLGQTFLQGVQQPLAAVNDPARYGQSYIGNQGSSIIPNVVKDTSKALDPYARENNNLSDYFTNSVPGLRNQNIIKRDNLGNPIPQEPTGAGAFLDLFNSKTPINNPVIDELSRLNNAGNNATPSKLGKNQTINGNKMSLTPEQLNTLESQVGPQVTQVLQSLFQDPQYQNLSDEEKAKAVDSVVSAVRKQVRGGIDLSSPAQTGSAVTFANNSGLSGTYTLVDPATGNVKRIDLSQSITAPTMTGSSALDKIAISKYNSAVSTRANDVYALYQAGKITQDQASQAIQQLSSQKILKGKKPKKIRVTASRSGGLRTKKLAIKSPSFKIKKSKTYTMSQPKTIRIKTSSGNHLAYKAKPFKNALTR